MSKKTTNKLKEDKGNAVAVLGLMLIILVLLVGGMMLDLTKAYQLKSSYISASKKATQSAIREQTTEGYLTQYAAAEAVRVYETITRPAVVNDGYFNHCGEDRNVEIKVVYKKLEGTEGKFIDESNPPTFVINSSLVNSTDTNAKILSKKDESKSSNLDKLTKTNSGYTSIEMQLTESTPNVVLPGAFGLSGGVKDDIKCQQMGIKSGASKFVGNNEEEGEGAYD